MGIDYNDSICTALRDEGIVRDAYAKRDYAQTMFLLTLILCSFMSICVFLVKDQYRHLRFRSGSNFVCMYFGILFSATH